MKKFELHLDAVIAMFIAFILSLGFNFYQHYQYEDLLREHTSLQMSSLGNDFNVSVTKASLKQCKQKLNEMKSASNLEKKPGGGS